MAAILAIKAKMDFKATMADVTKLAEQIQSPVSCTEGNAHVELHAWTLIYTKTSGAFLTLMFTTDTPLEVIGPKTWIMMDRLANENKHLFSHVSTSIYKLEHTMHH